MLWVYVTTVPLTGLTGANLIAAWMDSSPRRQCWLSAAVFIAVERATTFLYFIPTMIGLTSSELPEAEVEATLSQWLLFNHGRHVLTLSRWLMALKALSLPGERSGSPGAPADGRESGGAQLRGKGVGRWRFRRPPLSCCVMRPELTVAE